MVHQKKNYKMRSIFQKIFPTKQDIDAKVLQIPNSQTINEPKSEYYHNFTEHQLPDFQFSLTGNFALDIMSGIGKIDKVFKKAKIPFEVEGFYYTKLFEEGKLDIPVVFKAKHQAFSLFFLYNEDQIKTFNDARDRIKDAAFPNALFLAKVNPALSNERLFSLSRLKLSDLKYYHNLPLQGTYAMWWSTEEDAYFPNAPIQRLYHQIYTTIKGYETYMVGYILSEIKMKGYEDLNRVQLPNEQQEIPVKGPEYQPILISLSMEKGIRFHFSKENTNKNYIHHFLTQIHLSLKELRNLLEQQGIEEDTSRESCGLDWFQYITRLSEQKHLRGEINRDFILGGIQYTE